MKSLSRPFVFRAAFSVIVPLIAAWVSPLSLSAATPKTIESQNTPARDHHLFVGVDLFLRQNNEMVAVRKIEGDDALLDLPTPTSFPIKKSRGLQMKLATKVSDTAAEIEDLKSKRSYSPANDPIMRQMTDQMSVQMALADQADMNEASQRQLSQQAAVAASTAQNGETAQIRAEAAATESQLNEQLNEISNDLDQVQSLMDSDIFDVDPYYDDEDGDFDAITISFKLSSPTPIANAYVVALVRINHKDSLHDMSFYEHVGQVDAKPRKVSINHFGFPPGFEIQDTKVFLFSYGEEIPTNLSDKHYELTAAEAREFVNLDRQGLNRRASVPAKPAWEFAPAALRSSKNPKDFNYPVTVELDETGKLLAIKSGNQIVPDRVRAVVQETTFLPALENGKPTASTLTVNPIDFFKE